MIKKLITLVLFTTYLFSSNFELNSNINSFTLQDQFDKTHTVNSDTKTIIVSSEKATSAALNEFLGAKEKGFLENNNAVFIADISGMPSLITKFFALPKMKKYNYNILLITEENDDRFSKQEEKLTVYKLENGVITSINYVSKEEIPSIF
ncbi:MAG: hypothetical protein WBG69_02060 [Arcobacteraceae bacterium]